MEALSTPQLLLVEVSRLLLEIPVFVLVEPHRLFRPLMEGLCSKVLREEAFSLFALHRVLRIAKDPMIPPVPRELRARWALQMATTFLSAKNKQLTSR